MIAQRTDLLRLHNIVIASADPNVMPETTQCLYILPSVHPISIILRNQVTCADPRRKVSINCPITVLLSKKGLQYEL